MSRIHITTALLVGVTFAGCNCGGPEPEPAGIASIISRFANGNTVQADGISKLTVSLTATNKAHAPDLNPLTVSVPTGTGFLATKGGQLQPDTVTATPDAKGALDIDFQCPVNANDAVTLTATNGDATANIIVHCTQPQGQIVITVDDDQCNQKITNDGFSTCSMRLKIVERTATVDIPFDAPVDVKVTTVTPAQATGPTDDKVLGPANATAGAANEVNIPPDPANDGLFAFTFFAPQAQETATLTITAGAATSTVDVIVGLFDNKEAVTAAPATVSITGGRDATVVLTATNSDGTPATAAINTVSIDGTGATIEGGGLAAGTSLANVPLTNGQVTITVHTPTIANGDPSQTFTLSADFQPDPRLPVTHGTSVITVNPQGTLALNATAAPATTINSTDSAANRTVTLTITLDIDGSPINGANVDVVVDQASQADLNLDTTDQTKVVASNVDLSSGTATVDVLVESGVPSNTARVNLIGHANGTDTPTTAVDIKIARPPILTTIQFVAADPDTLGTVGASTVSGSSLPAVSTVTFKLIDDTGQPMSNIAVHFDKNATADRGIGVQQNAISAADGTVSTILSAGSIPGPVSVIATANDPTTNQLRIGQSKTIAIVNALPSFETSFLSCGAGGVAARTVPWSVQCSATVVDRFTNIVDAVLVQFFAEHGSEGATQVTSGGIAQSTVTFDSARGAPSPDLNDPVGSWSLAPLLPRPPASPAACKTDLSQCGDFSSSTNPSFDVPACFDGTKTTPCDLLELCQDGGLKQAFCPLNAQCIAGAVQAANILKAGLDPIKIAQGDPTETGRLQTYLAHFQDCGYPVSCLVGIPGGVGLSVTRGDECPVNLGCMDFDEATECPQAGVRTILATTRGAEAFSDANGNGLFDAPGTDPQQPQGETFVDLPEPFLDQNDNCQHDDMTQAPLYVNQPILQRANTDFFFDVDGNKQFGFTDKVVPNQLDRTNGVWDFDTEIMMATHMLEIGSSGFQLGEECLGQNVGDTHTCAAGGSAKCIETDGGAVFAPCNKLPDLDNQGRAAFDFVFRWSDENGNCPSVDMKDISNATVNGTVFLSGDTIVNLDTAACGFGDVTNPREPECSSQPELHAPLLHGHLVVNCQAGGTTATTTPSQATFVLGTSSHEFGFQVTCH